MAKRTQEDWLSGIESLLLSTDEADIGAAITKLDERDAWSALCEGTSVDCSEDTSFRATLTVGKVIAKTVSPAAREDLAWLALRRTAKLDHLRKIDLWKPKLTRLDAFSGLSALEELHIGAPALLVRAELHAMPALAVLDIAESKSLRELTLSALPSLRELTLQECKALVSVELRSSVAVPSLDLKDATKLERVVLDGASHLEQLELSVGAMSPDALASISCASLRTLILTQSKAKELALPAPAQVPALERIELTRSSTTSIAGITAHERLTSLRFWLLNKLKNLDFLSNSASLTSVSIGACPALASVRALHTLPALTELSMCDVACGRDAVSSLSNLTDLTLGQDASPERDLRGLSALRSLRSLSIAGSQLTSLDGIAALGQLVTLSLVRTELSSVSGVAACPSLTSFAVSMDEVITTLDGVESLPALTALSASYLPNLASVAAIEKLDKLRFLSVIDLPKISEESLDVIGSLSTLESLDLFTLPSLRSAPWLSKLAALQTLSISGCDAFFDASGIESCRSLTTLSFNGSPALTTVRNLRGMRSLTSLDVRNCPALDLTWSQSMASAEEIQRYFEHLDRQQ